MRGFCTFFQCRASVVAGMSAEPFFPHALEIAQPSFARKDAAADGTLRTLSRIDRAFINGPMAEARDFHCYSHVTYNLGERFIPSDLVKIRVVIQKPLGHCGTVKRIPSWMCNIPSSALF